MLALRSVSRPTHSIFERKLARQISTTVEADQYSQGIRWLHAAMAVGILSTFFFVKAAQSKKDDDPAKGKLMFYHKSCGFTMFGLIIVRTVLALRSRSPPHLEAPALIQLAGSLSHKAMYAMMWFMPLSGIVMGYYGGRGIPFWYTTIPGKTTPDPSISKPAWLYHKKVGQAFEILVPLHLGGVLYHGAWKSQAVLRRINPFA